MAIKIDNSSYPYLHITCKYCSLFTSTLNKYWILADSTLVKFSFNQLQILISKFFSLVIQRSKVNYSPCYVFYIFLGISVEGSVWIWLYVVWRWFHAIMTQWPWFRRLCKCIECTYVKNKTKQIKVWLQQSKYHQAWTEFILKYVFRSSKYLDNRWAECLSANPMKIWKQFIHGQLSSTLSFSLCVCLPLCKAPVLSAENAGCP